jgi:hypothetical protein
MSPVKYELGSYIPEDDILHSHCREKPNSNVAAVSCRRWAKSTLILVPLFGAHYVLFVWMSPSQKVNETLEIVCLFCDQLFASLQVSAEDTLRYRADCNSWL